MKTCEDCGCRVYNLGCVNCNEETYIKEQDAMTEHADGCEAWPAFPGHFQQASKTGKCTCGLDARKGRL